MKDRRKAVVSWSSGKDSAWALHMARQDPKIEIAGLLTTITSDFLRVSMHGVREELLERQAASMGLPLYKVAIPFPCPNDLYERSMAEALEGLKTMGVTDVIFGDLFLSDIRAYREAQMARIGMNPLFPLWLLDTGSLARCMISHGSRAFVTCVDRKKLPLDLCGRAYDETFLSMLPEGIDPCGENGEFHTFVWDGPIFSRPIPCHVVEVVERDGFAFADIEAE